MKNIIIFGAPGSGKGTYSDMIVEKYGMGHISTGDVLRAQIKAETELGKMAQGYINNGQLIPDALMIDILAKTYDEMPAGKGVIFDGFPRTIAQAEALKQMLAERGHEMGSFSFEDKEIYGSQIRNQIDHIVSAEIPDREILSIWQDTLTESVEQGLSPQAGFELLCERMDAWYE